MHFSLKEDYTGSNPVAPTRSKEDFNEALWARHNTLVRMLGNAHYTINLTNATCTCDCYKVIFEQWIEKIGSVAE